MAKQLNSISFRGADNGFIVSWSWEDVDSDGDTTWNSEEKVFLGKQKTEMKEFVSELIEELI